MKILIPFVLALTLGSTPFFRVPSFVQSVSATDQSGSYDSSLSTTSITTNSGDILFASISYYMFTGPPGPTITWSDDKGNSWHSSYCIDGSFSTFGICVSYAKVTSAGSTVVTASCSGGIGACQYPTMGVSEYSGVDTLDIQAQSTHTDPSVTSSFTTTDANEVVVCSATADNNSGFSVYTINSVGGTYRVYDHQVIIYDRIVSSILSSVTASVSAVGPNSLICESFKSGGGGGGPTFPSSLIQVITCCKPNWMVKW